VEIIARDLGHFPSALAGFLSYLNSEGEQQMRINDNEIKGKLNQASGAVKENVGRALGDPELESEGAGQRIDGNIESGVGKARRKVGEAVKDLGDKLGK